MSQQGTGSQNGGGRLAVLEIGLSSTYCSNCHRQAHWDEEGHVRLAGYGGQNGKPGCGAKWSGVYWVYGKPDECPWHVPDWIWRLSERVSFG